MEYKNNNITSLEDSLYIDDLLGCIKYKNEYHFYMSDITSYTLNYRKYDPEIEDRSPNFKKGVLNVIEENKLSYLEYLKDDISSRKLA